MGKTNSILFLGYQENQIIDFLRKDYEVKTQQEQVTPEQIRGINPSHIISYGYRHIIKPEVIKECPRIINLHIAYLPWNKGSNPNFWSWLENTPKGYTIHCIDRGVDTGKILAQEQENFDEENETLGSSYMKLRAGIEDLFIDSWADIANGKIKERVQMFGGSFHFAREFEKYKSLLAEKKWETPVSRIKAYGRENGLWVFDENGVKIK